MLYGEEFFCCFSKFSLQDADGICYMVLLTHV